MKEFSFERAAMAGDPMPAGLNGAEQVLYQGLALIYARYHAGAIDRQTAQEEKRELIQSYEGMVFKYRMWEDTAALWSKLEGPMNEFRRKPGVETAKRAMELLYGVKIRWEETS